MKDELRKGLADLIDETLHELEELKKSRFAASEIEIKGPGEGIDGKPSNGDLHAKAEDDKDDKDDKKKDEEAEKAEGSNEAAKSDDDPADAPEVGRKLKELTQKAEDDKDDKKKDKKEPHEDDPEHEEKEKKMAQKLLDMHKGEMKKSRDETESLLKSFVEERVRPLEDKLSTILDLVNKIADAPVPAKGATARVAVLHKSAEQDAGEQLSKSEIASKLFELKKSGTKVDSLDIARAEMGQDLNKIVEKYKIS